jgi:hypothetical protein
MVTDRDIERLIETASALKQGVEALYDAYGAFPPIIEREHRAIRASDFAEVKSACEAKEAAGAKVEDAFAALIKAGRTLGELRQRLSPPDAAAPHPVSLADCVEALGQLSAVVGEESAGGKVLAHLLRGTRELEAAFKGRYREVKPMIDANRTVVSTVLRNLQDSYRFWLEEVEKQALGYNAQGVQSAAGRNSGFKATA